MSARYAHDWREEPEGADMHGQGCLEQLALPLYQPPMCPERLQTEEKTQQESKSWNRCLKKKERRESEKPYAIPIERQMNINIYLLQSLVVNKTGSILGNLKLALLNLLAKFPAAQIAM